MARYSNQIAWKTFEDRVRRVILNMMDPMQVKLNSIDDNQSSINKKIAKLESKGDE